MRIFLRFRLLAALSREQASWDSRAARGRRGPDEGGGVGLAVDATATKRGSSTALRANARERNSAQRADKSSASDTARRGEVESGDD